LVQLEARDGLHELDTLSPAAVAALADALLVPPYVSRFLQRRGGAQALAGPPDGSFGAALQAYHDHNGFPYPGSRKGLPYDYVTIHDVHHVIGGLPSITWES